MKVQILIVVEPLAFWSQGPFAALKFAVCATYNKVCHVISNLIPKNILKLV
jgi:hypothetical protein